LFVISTVFTTILRLSLVLSPSTSSITSSHARPPRARGDTMPRYF
jgi:hypothetical protein